MQIKITYRGLGLIAVQLLFVLAFLVLVAALKGDDEQTEVRSLHAKEVIAEAQLLLATVVDAQTAIRGSIITGDTTFADADAAARRALPEQAARVQELVADNPEQAERARRIAEMAATNIAFMENLERLVRAGSIHLASEQVKTKEGERILNELRGAMADFLREEERLSDARRRSLEAAWQRFDFLLLAGAVADLLLSVALAISFTRGISKRVLTLTAKALALTEGKKLAPPMKGRDEIARLDEVFCRMAQALEASARKERAVVDNALDVICSVDGEGRFVKLNPACYRLWGYTPEELIGRRYIELVTPDDIEKTTAAAAAIMAGTPVTDFENRCRHKDGSLVHILWSASWSKSEALTFAVARDITERKRAEEKVRRLNEKLERYASRLEAANQELESFSYSVSHDLRAPLRHINGFADLLDRHSAAALDDKGRHYLTTISDAARQMGHLIDDLLSFSRMGRAEMRESSVDLNRMVADVRKEMAGEAAGRQITWQVTALPAVKADPAMLRQVFANLMANAVKYTRGRAEARIEIGARNGRADEVIFYVRDNGAGFDPKYVDKLFGVFQRLHRADQFEGTGIGLATVRRIIQRHGGQTWAEGVVDGGATFYFSLPKAQKG
ncbi:MAG TPA: ATP-binding protein [Blastocatellia bacterium]|nr:ATP-binding protein [Blastocatellia bacterium]